MQHFSSKALFGLLLLALVAGCRTAPKLPPIDLSAPGWKVRQGQALWRQKRDGPEIAGEVVLATHPSGRAFVQFLKNPLPILSAQTGADTWQIEFIPEGRRMAGRSKPPTQLIWLHLLRALQTVAPPPDLTVTTTNDGRTQIENKKSGEMITLFLNEA